MNAGGLIGFMMRMILRQANRIGRQAGQARAPRSPGDRQMQAQARKAMRMARRMGRF